MGDQPVWVHSAPRERAAISIEYGNGFRVSEAFCIEVVPDIDFVNGTVFVTRGSTRDI